ncbi:unnamed protein product [Pylaiella littoralis]
MQSVCIVYACLAVKRNAGILDKESKLAAAAKGYEEIAVPGFFRWARDNDIVLPAWLTVEKMGCSTLTGAPILFKDGAKLWSRFDTAMRVMKRDFNPIWDRYIKGQLGKNTLPSGQTGDDAIDNLLDGLHAQTPGTVDCPLGEDDLVEATSSGRVGGAGEEKIDGGGEGGGGGAKDTQQGGASGKEGRIDGVKQESEDDDGNGNGEGSPEELGDSNDYPERPKNWMHQYLMIFCLIGRPSSSEDPDLATARKTSGPPGRERTPRKQTTRGGKRKAGAAAAAAVARTSLATRAAQGPTVTSTRRPFGRLPGRVRLKVELKSRKRARRWQKTLPRRPIARRDWRKPLNWRRPWCRCRSLLPQSGY